MDCGHATTEKRQEEPTYPVDECPHEDVDYRGSSRTTHRVYCKQCCTYIDEAPVQVFKERTTIAKKVETVQVDKVPVIESIVDEDPQILTPGQLDKILPQFAQLVSSVAETEAITRSRLHELLHQSIDDALDDDSFSVVGEEGQLDPEFRPAAGYVGVCRHGSESHFLQDLV